MPTPPDTSDHPQDEVPEDSEGAESQSLVEPDPPIAEEIATTTPPPWYLRKVTVAAAVALGVILSGVGIYGLVSASGERSERDEALEATSQNLEEQGRIESATALALTQAQEAEDERAQILDELQAVEVDITGLETAIGTSETSIRELQSGVWGLYAAVERAVTLEQEISNKLEIAVERGNRRQVESMVRIAEGASESVDDLHAATESLEEHLDFDMTVSGFGLWEDSDASSGETTEEGYAISTVQEGVLAMGVSPYVWSDVAVEVTASAVESDTATVGYGVQCRVDDAGEYFGGYSFLIHTDGSVEIVLFDGSATGEVLFSSTPSDGVINLGPEENRVRVVCSGRELSLTVNGTTVWSSLDDTLGEGRIALQAVTWGDEPATVLFTDLHLSTALQGSES